jgi:hypothetical protein
VQYLYGGHARYLVASVPGDAWLAGTGQDVPLESMAQQEALLAQGWRGVAPGAQPGSLRLAAWAEGGARHG